MIPSGTPNRLLISGVEGWYTIHPHDQSVWPLAELSFSTERPPIHLQDLVVGSRVVGVRSYSGENLVMQVFQRWRTAWTERGDLLVVRPGELALISNQSAIPGEPDIKLLSLVHPGLEGEALSRVRRCLERLQQQRRTFGLGLGRYRYGFFQELGVEPLPLSSRYQTDDPDTPWHQLTLNYPEALICFELHQEPPQARVKPLSRPPARQFTG